MKISNFSIFIICLIGDVNALVAQESSDQTIKAEINEFGIYSTGQDWETKIVPQQTNGEVITIEEGYLVLASKKIPLIKGLTFGHCFYLMGEYGMLVEIQKSIEHPMLTKPDGTVTYGYEFTEPMKVENYKSEYCRTYTLKEEWQLVPGVWKMGMFYKGMLLLSIEYDLYSVVNNTKD